MRLLLAKQKPTAQRKGRHQEETAEDASGHLYQLPTSAESPELQRTENAILFSLDDYRPTGIIARGADHGSATIALFKATERAGYSRRSFCMIGNLRIMLGRNSSSTSPPASLAME